MVMVVDMRVFYTFNMFDHIKYMFVGGQPHRGRQGKPGGDDHGGR